MRISTHCFLIATTFALVACDSGTAPVEKIDTPDPELQETQGDGGLINYEATYTYSEKCKDLASVQCTLNISSQAGHSASESLMCATEFAACTATIVGGITGACDAGAVTPKTDDDFVVVVTYTSQLQFPPSVECFSGT